MSRTSHRWGAGWTPSLVPVRPLTPAPCCVVLLGLLLLWFCLQNRHSRTEEEEEVTLSSFSPDLQALCNRSELPLPASPVSMLPAPGSRSRSARGSRSVAPELSSECRRRTWRLDGFSLSCSLRLCLNSELLRLFYNFQQVQGPAAQRQLA